MGVWDDTRYLGRRKVLKLFGGTYWIYGSAGNLCLYVQQKAFKLKEDIRVYTDETMTQQVLAINARKILDFSLAYDVTDPAGGRKFGALRRRGLKSVLRDHWEILNELDQPIGTIQEDSMTKALVRRFLTNLVPQSFRFEVQGQTVGFVKQNFNPFLLKLDVDFNLDHGRMLPRQLGLAAVILLLAIEGRQ